MNQEQIAFEKVAHSIQAFKSISLEEMDAVSLMKRRDTKYTIPIKSLVSVLMELHNEYQVLEIKHRRLMNYTSVYFDTPAFKFYFDHHNGRVRRTKIRQRKYVDSELTFLEIKQKNGKGETKKSRIQLPDFESELSEKSKEFILKTTQESMELKPVLWNHFKRITLVNLHDNERVTIDLEMSYAKNTVEKNYENLVIVEVKQAQFNRNSKIVQILKKYRYNPFSVSKYCIGIVHLYKDLKYNLFKSKVLKINKISF